MEIKFTIPLNPVTKKNHGVRGRNGKQFPSKAYQNYEQNALMFIPCKHIKINKPVNVKAVYYTKIDYFKPGCKAVIDLQNLHNALADVLVTAGVLEDDNCRIVYSMDGSCVRHDKKNPRTEVTITEVEL